jgi:SET domain-containing protein
LDATFSSGLGRLVNDSEAKDANSQMRKIVIQGQPRLILSAKRNIKKGEELRYDYGVKDLPWRKQKGNSDKYNSY